MAVGNLPGKSFAYMGGLIDQNASVFARTPFTKELFLSIFWEETFYNNIAQTGAGHAVGFGQVEPAEFYRFDANGSLSGAAQAGGYLVENLPRRNGKALLGTLDDYTAVRVSCALVRDMYERGIKSKQSLLNAYGGVGFKGPQAAHLAKPGGREAILQGMLDCERALKAATGPADVMSALKLAREFNQDDDFKNILFP